MVSPTKAESLPCLEAIWTKGRRRNRDVILATGALASVLGIYCLARGEVVSAALATLFGGAISFAIMKYRRRRLRTAFKQRILPLLLADIDPTLTYQASDSISLDEFNAAKLFDQPDAFSGKDLVEGYVNNARIRFSYVCATEDTEATSTDSDGHTQASRETKIIFSGWFFIGDFNKHFTGLTRVSSRLPKFLTKLTGTHVALEDPEFNEVFSVRASDQMEARYLLTSSFMEKLKALRSTLRKFEASFNSGQIYLAIDMPANIFEPKGSGPFNLEDEVHRIGMSLNRITGIVKSLGLDAHP